MAQIAATFETYDAKGVREELADKINMIDPEETPLRSMIGQVAITSTHPEWQLDTLATPDVNNNSPEGNDYTYDAITATTRVGSYAQISEKTFLISGTLEEVVKAGRTSELAYQTAKRGKELKIDQEVILMSNQASSAGSGNGATNRTLGGLRAWLATNDSLGATGASGGYNTSTNVVDAATNGNQRAFTKALLDEVVLSTYNAGGSPKVLMVSPYVKTVFSTLLDASDIVASQRTTSGDGPTTLIAAADAYRSDFGLISVVPNRQMARAGATIARNAFLLDPSMVKLGVLRDIFLDKPSKTGDADKRALVTEYTLIVKNEASCGVIADLYGMTAST